MLFNFLKNKISNFDSEKGNPNISASNNQQNKAKLIIRELTKK